MQKIFKIVLDMSHMSNPDLLAFIKRVTVKMNLNPFYPSMVNPTWSELNTIVTDFENANKAWGNVHNHGASVDKVRLYDMRVLAEQALRDVSTFCEHKTPNNAEAFLSAGFVINKPNTRVGDLPNAENLRQHVSKTIPSGAVMMKWNRPASIGKNAVKAYVVLNGPTSDVNDAVQIATVTKTSFIDVHAANRPANFYWVIPVGSAGKGKISEVAIGYPTGPVVTV